MTGWWFRWWLWPPTPTTTTNESQWLVASGGFSCHFRWDHNQPQPPTSHNDSLVVFLAISSSRGSRRDTSRVQVCSFFWVQFFFTTINNYLGVTMPTNGNNNSSSRHPRLEPYFSLVIFFFSFTNTFLKLDSVFRYHCTTTTCLATTTTTAASSITWRRERLQLRLLF